MIFIPSAPSGPAAHAWRLKRPALRCGRCYRAGADLIVAHTPSALAGTRLIVAVLAVLSCITLFAAASKASAQDARPAAQLLAQAATLIGENRLAEAEQQLNRILKGRPADALALNLLGTIRAKQGRLAEAEELFVRAARIDGRFVGAHMNLAYLYLLRGAPEKTVRELEEVLRIEPENADAGYKLARLLFAQGRLDECIDFIERARQARPLPPPLAVLLGDAYLKKGDPQRAEASYLLALDAEGQNADALLGLALVARAKGDAATSALYLTRAKEVIADSPESLYRFATSALKLELYDDARWALERAARLRPEEAAYAVALGAAWLKKPDLFEAEKVFRHALQLQPESPQAQMYLGYTLLKQKKYPEAREWLERSVRKDTTTPETFYYLGLIAQEQNEDERAIGFFEKAVALLPSFANARIALGSTYLKLKNYQRAREALEAGVKLKPDDSKAHYNLARLYAQLKDTRRAQEEMLIVEKLKSDDKRRATESDITAPPQSPR